MDENERITQLNAKLKLELKQAYSEIAELKQRTVI